MTPSVPGEEEKKKGHSTRMYVSGSSKFSLKWNKLNLAAQTPNNWLKTWVKEVKILFQVKGTKIDAKTANEFAAPSPYAIIQPGQ